MPCILYNGELIEDTRFILPWLTQHRGIDLDASLTEDQRVVSHGLVRMLEESTYFALVYSRWQDDVGASAVHQL
jgi:hypothetical protein